MGKGKRNKSERKDNHTDEILFIKEDDLISEFTFRKRSEHFKFGLDTNIEQDKIINYEFNCEDTYTSNNIVRMYNLKTTSKGILT